MGLNASNNGDDPRVAKTVKRKYSDNVSQCQSMEQLGVWQEIVKIPELDIDYWEYLTSDCMSRSKYDNHGAVNIDDVEDDPQYEKFLASLEVNGSAYTLQLDDYNGLAKPLKYEIEDGSGDEMEINISGKMKDVIVGENINELEEFCPDSMLELERTEILGFPPEKRRREHEVDMDVFCRPVTPVPSLDEQSLVEELNPESDSPCNFNVKCGLPKKQKRQALGKSGKVTHARKKKQKSGLLIDEDGYHSNSLKIEQHPVEEFTPVSDIPHKFAMRSGWSMKRQKTQVLGKSRKVTDGLVERENSLIPDDDSLGSQWCAVEEFDPMSDSPCKFDMQGDSATEPKTQVLGESGKLTNGCEETGNNVTIDDDYAFYVNNLKIEGTNMICVFGNLQVAYGVDEHPQNFQVDDGESLKKGNSQDSIPAPEFDPGLDRENSCLYLGSPSRGKHSKFRERIMRILRRPYNSNELENLMNEITDRKPVGRHMEFRNGRERCISGNKMGKSLLDCHADFKRKLDAAKDNHEKLNLLRGFFFWLQNVAHDGSFVPWLDSSCLAM